MNNKKKIAWLIIGGAIVLGIISSNIGKLYEKPQKKNFWSSVDNNLQNLTETTVSGSGNDKIVIIKIEGVLTDQASSTSSLLSSTNSATAENVAKQLDQAEADSNVKAIILQVNSPGGTAVAGQTILERLAKFRESNKKIYVAMREVAASAAYEVSLPADRIFANPETETGSIGVVMELSNYAGLYDKVGLQSVVIKSGPKKDIGSPTRAMTDDERSILQSMVDESYDNFVAAVAKWRKLDEAKVRSIADGRVYSAKQALTLGLIDEIGNMPAVINYAKQQSNLSEATVVQYEAGPLSNIFSTIFQRISLNSQLSGLLGQNESYRTNKLMHIWEQ